MKKLLWLAVLAVGFVVSIPHDAKITADVQVTTNDFVPPNMD